MKTKFEKGQLIWNFWSDFFKLVEYYYIVEPENQAYWDELIDTTTKLSKRYKDLPIAKHLILGYMNYLGEENKRLMREKGDRNYGRDILERDDESEC